MRTYYQRGQRDAFHKLGLKLPSAMDGELVGHLKSMGIGGTVGGLGGYLGSDDDHKLRGIALGGAGGAAAGSGVKHLINTRAAQQAMKDYEIARDVVNSKRNGDAVAFGEKMNGIGARAEAAFDARLRRPF